MPEPPLHARQLEVLVVPRSLVRRDDATVEAAERLLSQPERLRAARFTDPAARRVWVLARGEARRVLSGVLDVPAAAVPLATTPGGRTYLPEGPELSVAHTTSAVLVAVAPVPVGVDLEDAPDAGDDAGIAELVLSPGELAAWRRCPPGLAHDRLLRAWARKEAVLKGVGVGFAVDPRTVEVGAGAEPVDSLHVPARQVVAAGGDLRRAGHWQLLDLPAAAGGAAALAVRSSHSVRVSDTVRDEGQPNRPG